jgi:hypothetical protein
MVATLGPDAWPPPPLDEFAAMIRGLQACPVNGM